MYGFKLGAGKKDLRVLASRMSFVGENKIRIINKHGLDTIIELNIDSDGVCLDDVNPIKIKSICGVDHFNPNILKEKHALLD